MFRKHKRNAELLNRFSYVFIIATFAFLPSYFYHDHTSSSKTDQACPTFNEQHSHIANAVCSFICSHFGIELSLHIHTVSSLLLFILVERFLSTRRFYDQRICRSCGALVAVIFAVHPLSKDLVLTSSLHSTIAVLLMLLGLIFYVPFLVDNRMSSSNVIKALISAVLISDNLALSVVTVLLFGSRSKLAWMISLFSVAKGLFFNNVFRAGLLTVEADGKNLILSLCDVYRVSKSFFSGNFVERTVPHRLDIPNEITEEHVEFVVSFSVLVVSGFILFKSLLGGSRKSNAATIAFSLFAFNAINVWLDSSRSLSCYSSCCFYCVVLAIGLADAWAAPLMATASLSGTQTSPTVTVLKTTGSSSRSSRLGIPLPSILSSPATLAFRLTVLASCAFGLLAYCRRPPEEH